MNEKMALHIMVVFAIVPFLSIGQDTSPNTADRLIEGGNLIVEILKIVQSNEVDRTDKSPSNQRDCETKKFTNICFVNKSKDRIHVFLKRNNTEKKYELVIGADGKECCYQISPGVYQYCLTRSNNLEEAPFRKGEILLEVCKDVEVKIK